MWRLPLCGPNLAAEGVKKEQRAFTDDEVRRMIQAAPEPFGTILAITAVLGLRIGETLGLRVCDVDFAKRIIRVRQSVDSASRTIGGTKSRASSADMPMSTELEARLRSHLSRLDGKSELLFLNRNGRPFCADKLREKKLYPLLDALKIPRGEFHGMRHGAASALLADGASPALVQKQFATVTRESRWQCTRTFWATSNARQSRIIVRGS
jgi:integrase